MLRQRINKVVFLYSCPHNNLQQKLNSPILSNQMGLSGNFQENWNSKKIQKLKRRQEQIKMFYQNQHMCRRLTMKDSKMVVGEGKRQAQKCTILNESPVETKQQVNLKYSAVKNKIKIAPLNIKLTQYLLQYKQKVSWINQNKIYEQRFFDTQQDICLNSKKVQTETVVFEPYTEQSQEKLKRHKIEKDNKNNKLNYLLFFTVIMLVFLLPFLQIMRK